MYLLASRVSTSPSIRSLEKHFYSIASRQLDESLAKADRLFDATRAATLLAVYKYSNARYHEGWMMVGMAARCVILIFSKILQLNGQTWYLLRSASDHVVGLQAQSDIPEPSGGSEQYNEEEELLLASSC